MSVVVCPNGCPWSRSTHKRPVQCVYGRFTRRSLRRRCLASLRSSFPSAKQRLKRIPKPRRQHSLGVQSALGFVSYINPSPDIFDAAINSLVGGSAMVCFALAFVPLLTYEEESEEQERDELDAVKWSVASVVSCLPYLNWTSWLLVAFDSDPPLPYYFLSALYLIPFLKSGFDLNPFSFFMLILGIMHMQVERVAQTEPAMFGTMVAERPNLRLALRQFSDSISHQLSRIASKQQTNFEKQARKRDSISEMVDRELTNQEKELRDAEELARIEQQIWDKKFDKDDRNQ